MKIDVSEHVSEEECPLCGMFVWRAVVVELEVVAYFVLIDRNGCPPEEYHVPRNEPTAVGWPRYAPSPASGVLHSAAQGPLWAHGCFVPREAWPEDQRRSERHQRARLVRAKVTTA